MLSRNAPASRRSRGLTWLPSWFCGGSKHNDESQVEETGSTIFVMTDGTTVPVRNVIVTIVKVSRHRKVGLSEIGNPHLVAVDTALTFDTNIQLSAELRQLKASFAPQSESNEYMLPAGLQFSKPGLPSGPNNSAVEKKRRREITVFRPEPAASEELEAPPQVPKRKTRKAAPPMLPREFNVPYGLMGPDLIESRPSTSTSSTFTAKERRDSVSTNQTRVARRPDGWV